MWKTEEVPVNSVQHNPELKVFVIDTVTCKYCSGEGYLSYDGERESCPYCCGSGELDVVERWMEENAQTIS